MQGCAILFVEPITRIRGKKLDFSVFRQVGRFIYDQAPLVHSRLERHAE